MWAESSVKQDVTGLELWPLIIGRFEGQIA